MADTDTFDGWAILELLGHRRLGGYLSEATIAGASFLRIDIPQAGDDHPPVTQFYSASSVYAITPTTEEVATAAARYVRFQPVNRWQLQLEPARRPDADPDFEDA